MDIILLLIILSTIFIIVGFCSIFGCCSDRLNVPEPQNPEEIEMGQVIAPFIAPDDDMVTTG